MDPGQIGRLFLEEGQSHAAPRLETAPETPTASPRGFCDAADLPFLSGEERDDLIGVAQRLRLKDESLHSEQGQGGGSPPHLMAFAGHGAISGSAIVAQGYGTGFGVGGVILAWQCLTA